MPWPPWSKDDSKDADSLYIQNLKAESAVQKNWSDWVRPGYVMAAVVGGAGALVVRRVYKGYIRRIPNTEQIYPGFFRKRSLYGYVTYVGDGDNFRMFHTPGGGLLGWGWLRHVPSDRKALVGKTIAIRIAGVDAPEAAHFGKKAQPFAEEAISFLKGFVLNQPVRAYIYRRDQYDRVVARVTVGRLVWRKDVGLELLKAGLATVYEGTRGAEFGHLEATYRLAEQTAKTKKISMWGKSRTNFVSPYAYKKALREGTEKTIK
ncbi:putative endonuclease lcl3 [Rhizina undulata]